MRYRLYIFLILALPYFNGSSQNITKINDLKYKVQIEVNVNKKAEQLLLLSKLYEGYDNEEAMKYALESLTLSKGLHYNKGKISAYYQIGQLEKLSENYNKAINSFELANEISESYGDQKGVAIGTIYIGDVHLSKQDFESARIYYQYALDIGEKVKSLQVQAMANDGFGKISEQQEKLYLAQQYFVLAKEHIQSSSELNTKGMIFSNSGRIEAKLGNTENAIKDYQVALKSFEQVKNKEKQAIVCFELGALYQLTTEKDESIVYYKTGLGLAQETGMEDLIKSGYQTIAETYEKNGQFEEAYEYLKYFSAIKDTKEITELESQLELEMKNNEIELIKKEKALEKELHDEAIKNERFYSTIGLVVLLVIFGLAIFLFISLKQRDKINAKLIKAKDEANQSRQEKEDFFAYTSHEIRTPLNAVVGMAKLLGETDLNESQQKYLKTITGSAQNILFLVNDVLDLTKIEKGGIEFESIKFSLHEIIDQIIQSLSFKKFEKEVDIVANIHPNVPKVIIGDPIRFNQILLNLADNALKFTKQGEVTITLRVTDRYEDKVRLFVSVDDTGIGIQPEKLDSIFNSYQQEHISTTRQYGGTGLGLAISKLLIEKMGGEIKVKSKPGVGTSFYFDLWISTTSEDAENLETNQSTETDKLQNLNVLVVDDNQLNREIFFDLVEDKHNNVLVDLAKHGEEAIEKLKAKDYDLILMDIQMPVMNGYEAAKAIRNHKELDETKRDIPIIAMTAHVLEGVAEKCLAAGMNDSISKPVNLTVLHQKIRTLVKKEGIFGPDKRLVRSGTPSSNEVNGSRINLENLEAITGGKPEKIERYIKIFLKNIPADLDKLKQEFDQEDYENIKKTAHKIKGNLAYMGVTSIQDNILYLEGLDTENINVNEINSNLNMVEKEIVLILEELRTLNANPT
ncbi:tetratricopeptide repeat-containing hybrid sensor histidine kinase/response regulator [Parvicella tangerina]|uniref:tetratricopeptide repeat-containing hybrid sensor histidine kinase/response regulator n=1 Tax=Parvicella tangerina TaxID=2829795 RepID=UPI00215C2801|nr:ATP-binding protein [Parvicella tangerina]